MYVCILFAIVIYLASRLIQHIKHRSWLQPANDLTAQLHFITAHILGLLIFFSGCMFSTNVLKLFFEVVLNWGCSFTCDGYTDMMTDYYWLLKLNDLPARVSVIFNSRENAYECHWVWLMCDTFATAHLTTSLCQYTLEWWVQGLEW